MSISLSGRTAAVGVGYRQYKRGTAPVPERGVLVRAIVDACEDAGFDPAEVDGFVSYGDDKNEPVRLMPDLGTKELNWSAQVWGGGGGGIAGAFGLAASAILTGQARAVIVFRALVEGNSGRLSAAVMAHHLNDHMVSAGILAPAQVCAMRAQRMFEHHGVPQELCAELVRASYYHGSRNPEAVAYGKDFDLDEYRRSRIIAEPFHLFDCSRENDGAGAILLVSAEMARDLRKKPVKLLSVAQGTQAGYGDLLENDAEALYPTAGFRAIRDRLFGIAGLTPADIDVVQLYENFSAQGIASLIDHGFCTYENVAELVRFENLIAPGGKLPVNTSGGNLAHGFVHGFVTAVEAVRCLRGESPNPVPDARTCLLAGGPGAPTISSAIFGVD
ncbi:transporter [Sphingopyxis sp. GW247-27LB]|jgi:acetyl-CoA acetyltransferase|uniref:thiolase C-terminal domain-containing protein n=1 Tax=Sphingopyxis sp. GW247-27LB TaxID=2012632 RepID=UPI000BA6185C|nr:transporter [Sphingopyxis sp. GW247-27LB]PAL22048.1 transporter [Sphingopyxis sp. GW247-27LB]